ncbi:MAG: SAM-dependent chlorinase/fluorinase [Chloroflexi bacterium]|nr:SAM-dependent chlorinase/fluorinase [Chloroflexota bacterium]
MAGPIITLTTDFGTADGFVGVLKGVILGINPSVTIVDITHEVPPQNIQAGAFTFGTAHPYFPPDTVHLVVVDPGVGTGRRPILVIGPQACYVAPDNGVLSYLFPEAQTPAAPGDALTSIQVSLPEGWHAYHLTNSHYWRDPVSSTFHGRDVFAPVAANLSNGVAPADMGDPVDTIAAFVIPTPVLDAGVLLGCVLHTDRYGNIITNVTAEDLPLAGAQVTVHIGGRRIDGLAISYQDADLVALIGSHGYLEVAARNGNAAKLLGVSTGGEVTVTVG